jgi:hypothetical protein
MSYHLAHYRSLTERTLKEIGLFSIEAVELILGTTAKESDFGKYLKQLGNGPALGALQIERPTFNDLKQRFGNRFPSIQSFCFEQLEWDLKASIVIARIKYFSCPGPIPKDLMGQAQYWKRYYNTYLGSGTVEEYLESYRRYVA